MFSPLTIKKEKKSLRPLEGPLEDEYKLSPCINLDIDIIIITLKLSWTRVKGVGTDTTITS